MLCPDCRGRAGNLNCARCEGSGEVCERCKGTGFLYRLASDGHTATVECTCGKVSERRRNVLWPFLERYSSLHGELQHKSFENFKARPGLPEVQQAYHASLNFVRQPHGWLFFNGNTGVGKTHLAAAMANALLARGQLVLFLNVPELLNFLRAGFHARDARDPDFDTRLQTIKDFPILILDDWGAQSDTPWADEQLYLILNHRTERALPTVVTSNQPLKDIEPRVRSRLMNRHLGKMVEMLAPDYRDPRLVFES